ncbi:hypothetical protein SpCBS45565_g03030 [Spizellomyces sp. 'palustris']|nr:hypothetical protein SpCBS45565_g03030 [Spizellomyces sp. 'palustris']
MTGPSQVVADRQKARSRARILPYLQVTMANILLAVSYVLGSTLACVLGAATIFINRIPFTQTKLVESRAFMALAMSISAGTLLYTSLVDLIPEAQENLRNSKTFKKSADFILLGLFILGVGMTMGLNSNVSLPFCAQYEVMYVFFSPSSIFLELLLWFNPSGHGCACHVDIRQTAIDDTSSGDDYDYDKVDDTIGDDRGSNTHTVDVRSLSLRLPEFAVSWEEDQWMREIEARRNYGAIRPFPPSSTTKGKQSQPDVSSQDAELGYGGAPLIGEDATHCKSSDACDIPGKCAKPPVGELSRSVDVVQTKPNRGHCHHPSSHHQHHHHHHHDQSDHHHHHPHHDHYQHHHHHHSDDHEEESSSTQYAALLAPRPAAPTRNPSSRMYSVGLATAVTISLHKLPEGFVIFTTTAFYSNKTTGALIFLALSLHNLTEGLAIALPIFLGTSNRKRAFGYAAALGGLTQPLGAVVGWFLVCVGNPARTARCAAAHHELHGGKALPGWEEAFGCLFSFVSGMMFWVAADGLLPAAWSVAGRHEEGDRHAGKKFVSIGLVVGVILMVFCEALMA